VEDISHVYNYDVPRDANSYTHRIGRTARVGKAGAAISIVTGEDQRSFTRILERNRDMITRLEAGNIPRAVFHMPERRHSHHGHRYSDRGSFHSRAPRRW
jgi:superfamily II DNA/RNA helicase